MARRRAWNTLSPAYRARLLRSGITPKTYEGGASLKKARGHEHTPERPEEAINRPSRYQSYRSRVKDLQQEVWERKQRLFDNTLWWKEGNARKWVYAPDSGKPPGLRVMKKFMAMTDDEIYNKASDAGKDYRDGVGLEDDWYFLLYH